MIRHLLLISFDEKITEIDLFRIKTAFTSIQEKIPGILSIEWGENDSPEGKNKGYTHCVNILLNGRVARDVYLKHPEHTILKGIFNPFIKDLIVFDYYC
ncbi:Dabb family protein [Hafnia paralvei]|uniref:Dabb family protein n=1 Tax=Hafnia paralvei TaxID=546367 RepID=UPI0014196033|nr:Dabb family protein [Hafnia paralvei]NIH33123.1 Dabb family protein [Hafnia paralvei]